MKNYINKISQEIKIKQPQKLQNNIQNSVMEEKFNKMIDIQNNSIKRNMKEGKESVLWIFSDKEYYHNDLEKTWFNLFYDRAKKMFEKNGYIISGVIIKW